MIKAEVELYNWMVTSSGADAGTVKEFWNSYLYEKFTNLCVFFKPYKSFMWPCILKTVFFTSSFTFKSSNFKKHSSLKI